jgi:hypothetical protein
MLPQKILLKNHFGLKQQRADSLGVDIINTSLGYFEFDNQAYNHTYEMNGSTAFMTVDQKLHLVEVCC